MTVHIPILVSPIIEALSEAAKNFSEPAWFLDCTFGGGGHTEALYQALGRKHKILAIDQDAKAVENGRIKFSKEISDGDLEIQNCRMSEVLPFLENRKLIGVLADLGFSSDQLEDQQRGLSFKSQGPLDMRLDPNRGISCYQLLEEISEKDLEELIRTLGEERFSRRIASSIVYHRSLGTLPTTPQELSQLIVKAIPPFARHGKIHAATRTFQALRIAVNDELSELDFLLAEVVSKVQPLGRCAILSFHSLEDRKVKIRFKDKEVFRSLTKKPIQADEKEIQVNPRARPAKLRIAERI